jgi:hypothetical protein
MAEPSIGEQSLSPSWLEVLRRVEEAIRQAEAAAAEREPAAGASGLESTPRRDPAWFQCQQCLQECLDGLEGCAARATQSVQQAEEAISAGEDVIRHWQEACRAVVQKLAKGATAAI